MARFLSRLLRRFRPVPRRLREAPGVGRSVDLAVADAGSGDVVTPIPRTDNLYPADHHVPFPAPNQADLRLMVTQKIEELARAGSVDETSGGVLHHWIDALGEQWKNLVTVEAGRRRRAAGLYYAAELQNLGRETATLRWLTEQLEEVRDERRALLASSRPELAATPDPTSSARPAALELAPIPSAPPIPTAALASLLRGGATPAAGDGAQRTSRDRAPAVTVPRR